MVRVWQLPRRIRLLALAHEFEVINHLLGLTSLLKSCRHQLDKLPLVGLVSLTVNSKEDWSAIVLYD